MNEDEQTNRLRWAGWLLAGLLLVAGVGYLIFTLLQGGTTQVRHAPRTVLKVVLPPPPPPPPPPKPPPPKPPERQKETPPKESVPKPSNAPPKPAAHPVARPPGNPLTAPLGTGSNPYGLQSGNGSGDVIGGGGGGGGSGGGDLYDQEMSSQIRAALESDPTTRYGHFAGSLRVTVDASGRIVDVSVVRFSGDDGMEAAVRRVLADLRFGPPPGGGTYLQTIMVTGR